MVGYYVCLELKLSSRLRVSRALRTCAISIALDERLGCRAAQITAGSRASASVCWSPLRQAINAEMTFDKSVTALTHCDMPCSGQGGMKSREEKVSL
jgi:hypothetical protein